MLSFLFLKFNKNSTKDEKNIDIDSDIKIRVFGFYGGKGPISYSFPIS